MKKMIALVLSAMLLTLSVSAAGSVPSVGAKSVILMDRRTGRVLYEENADERLPIASVTKVMTLLLICEALEAGKISLEEPVTASANASGMGGSQIYLKEGESMPLEDML
ncbi:MAG: D-alanyl-D-alanine carboxypeptidase, partial [Oscillospiraceae bacterium]|nr:D-alanyl-D-alanine carboxypeptidase [Oscillospiraceae bacterium]